MDYSMAPSVGFLTMKENLGKISNKGYEVTLRLMPYSNPSKEAYWNIIFTGSHNKSRIEQISNALKVMKNKWPLPMKLKILTKRISPISGKRVLCPVMKTVIHKRRFGPFARWGSILRQAGKCF